MLRTCHAPPELLPLERKPSGSHSLYATADMQLYTNELHKLGVHALGLPWDTQEDWRAMVGALEVCREVHVMRTARRPHQIWTCPERIGLSSF